NRSEDGLHAAENSSVISSELAGMSGACRRRMLPMSQGRDERSTQLVPPGEEHVDIQQFRLTVLSGPDAGASFASEASQVVVGTHQSCDFVLTDSTVSRFHCEIELSQGRAMFRDLGSRNGSIVEGLHVVLAFLRTGSEITLGT